MFHEDTGPVIGLYGNMHPVLDIVKPALTSASMRLRGYEEDSGAQADSDAGREPNSCGDYCFKLYGDERYMVNFHFHISHTRRLSHGYLLG